MEMRTESQEEGKVLPTDPKLMNVFMKYDMDSSGTMDEKELQSALEELNVFLNKKEIQSIVRDADVNEDGVLHFDEFSSIFGVAKLLSVFCEIDQSNNGKISEDELQLALSNLGYKQFTRSKIKALLQKVDTNTSGDVDFDEFKEFFKYVPATSLAILAKSWIEGINFDCGSDLAPPTISPDVPWHYAILGGMGGVASRTMTAPLEKVKVTAQTTGTASPFQEWKHSYSKLGIRGLFAGNLTNCIRVFPYAGIVTACYLKLLPMTPADQDLDIMEPIYRGACAASAGILGQLVTYPLDVIRARMTVNPEAYSSIVECSLGIVSKEGWGGLYKGLTPTLFAVAPFLAFQLSTADVLKSYCASKNIEITVPVMAGIGGTAGLVAQTAVYPLDVLRRRAQLAHNTHSVTGNSWKTAIQLIQKEGVKSLFAGIGVTYLKIFPAVAIAMTCTKELIGYSKRNWEE